jgi:hypothetical protein
LPNSKPYSNSLTFVNRKLTPEGQLYCFSATEWQLISAQGSALGEMNGLTTIRPERATEFE